MDEKGCLKQLNDCVCFGKSAFLTVVYTRSLIIYYKLLRIVKLAGNYKGYQGTVADLKLLRHFLAV